MKLGIALYPLVAAVICILSSLTPREAAASVDFINQWPVKPVIISNSSTGTVSGKFTPGVGTNRLMLVAVATEYTSASTPGLTVTYGGQAVTQIVTTGSFVNGLWLGYVKEGGVAAGAAGNKTLLVVNTVTANLTAMYATVAVFNGVDQTTPITGSNAAATAGAASLALTVPLTGNAGLTGNTGMSVYLANWNGQTSTPATGYTELRDYAGTNFNLAASYKVITGTANETPTSTAAASAAGAAAGVSINPVTKLNGGTNYAAVTTCGDCHGYYPNDGTNRNKPFGMFSGSHEKHTGGSNSNNQYSFVCTQCHYNNTTYNHARGYVNITGSSLPGNAYSIGKSVAFTNNPTLGTCNNTTCHSNGRTTPRQYATSPNWGGGKATCLSCHGGRSSTTNLYSKSANNFSLSTTHGQHLGKYDYTQINCNTCHGKTAANHTALKDYTGVQYHANGSKTVIFTNIAYGSYTSYKANKTCANVSCHGGVTRGSWNENTTVNTNNTCVHCHGVGNTAASVQNVAANRKFFAPGYKAGGISGISTDATASSNNVRVGAHFKHISSAYMKSIRCNECHRVPNTPFDAGHTDSPRYNSQTLTFNQASTATIALGVSSASTPAILASFIGYTNGTATKAATCSSVYCHGNRLKTGDTSGSYRMPYWNYSAMINYTDPTQACGRCHGLPPSTGDTALTHSGKTLTGANACSNCHSMVVNSSGVIINKNLHINGRVDGGGHAWPYPGSTHGPLAGAASYTACTGCHTNWNAAPNTYPFTRGDALQITCKTCHKGSTFNTGSQGCADCHGDATGRPSNNTSVGGNVFPNISGSHGKHVVQKGFACTVCHATYGTGSPNHGSSGGQLSQQTIAFVHVTSATAQFGDFTYTKKDHATAGKGSCANNACHGLAEWGVDKLDCISCHSSQMTITAGPLAGQTRAAVAASLKTSGTRNHKSSAVGSDASKWDCIVCHMEGDTSTGSTSAQHGNGVIDFRDPDTGTQVKKVAWIGGAPALGNATGKYIDTLTNFTTSRFRRDLSVTFETETPTNSWLQVASIQKNLCLHCHDYNGASSTLAQTKAIASTALQPFGNAVANTATQYPVRGTIRTAAGNTSSSVMNVFSMFSSGNASYHPVVGRNNNGRVRGANMKAPWNGGTPAASNTIYGYLISCFDCHAPQGAGIGSNTVLTSTVVAHGNTSTTLLAAMMRGPSTRNQATVANPNLCTYCHADAYATTSNTHQSTSGFIASGSMSTSTMGLCGNCHTGNIDAPGARAVGAHGADLNENGAATWPTTNSRPYAFWRGTNVTYWGPGSCSLTNLTGGSCTTQTYTPGGLY